MKNCELCKLPARTYCESDLASLCWDCDAKVHGANFLVARHVRCLLCHTCQSLTPWRAAGAKLGHTVSVCENCVNGGGGDESEAENDEEEEIDTDDDDSGGDDDAEADEEEDGDNQVVPWSTVANTPPPASSPSGSEVSEGEAEDLESVNVFSFRRMQENTSDPRPQEGLDCSSSKRKYGSVVAVDDDGDSVDSMRPLKDRRIQPDRRLLRVHCVSKAVAGESEAVGLYIPGEKQP